MPNFAPQPGPSGQIQVKPWVENGAPGTPGASQSNGATSSVDWGSVGSTIQQGKPQGHLSSLNTSGPGAGESYFASNAPAWQSPSYGEVNAQGIVGQYSDPNNRAQTTQNTQDWFSQYKGQMPSISSEPGFGAYFDNAKSRAEESINQAMAARGAYGSSAANDQTARAFTDLEGQRALKEADYNLQRLAEQRGWQSLGGQLAGSADSNSLASAGLEKDWASLLGQLGLDASQLGLGRTNAGMDAAIAAQGAQRQRGQDYFNNQLSVADRMADLYKSTILPALDNDAAMMENASSGGVAQGNQAAANERTNMQDSVDAFNTGMSLYQGFR